jgi:hypothetical protein
MLNQVFSAYYNLALEGKVDFLACPMHQGDEPAVFPLIHSSEDEKIVLHCLACGYRNWAGQQLYENILEKVKRFTNDDNSEELYEG